MPASSLFDEFVGRKSTKIKKYTIAIKIHRHNKALNRWSECERKRKFAPKNNKKEGSNNNSINIDTLSKVKKVPHVKQFK